MSSLLLSRVPRSCAFGLTLLALICCGSPPAERSLDTDDPVEPGPDSELVAADLRSIAADYEQFGRLDDEARWAPYLCRRPNPPSARVSASEHDGSHGRKLYTLYAKDPMAYAGLPRSSSPNLLGEPAPLAELGQVLVKEAFRPVPYEGRLEGAGLDQDSALWGPAQLRPVEHAGASWRAGEPLGLFVMYQPRAGTPGTDAGWLYGVIDADRETILEQGRVASCMSCHEQAGPTRLFGWEGRESQDE